MPKRSTIIIEFILPPDSWTPDEKDFLQVVPKFAAEAGEPWLTYFTPDEISERLTGLGFSRISHLTPDDAVGRYFMNRQDGLRPPDYVRLLQADV
jgi:O-methyltransferase involved in polyketide biosynthesis